MITYDQLRELMLQSLQRAQALEHIEILRDLYEDEVDEAARGLRALILHPQHRTGRIPAEVMEEVNSRDREVHPGLYSQGAPS